jgi:probable F420-dependent oxidoreductase
MKSIPLSTVSDYMKFGIALENFAPPGKTISCSSIFEMAVRAEALGFDSVWTWDHLLLGSRKVFPVLDSLTTLSAIGSRTQRIELATGVLIISLRNPLVLSKIVSTIQYLTGGRLKLGVAAGWYEREFRAVGIDFHRRGAIFEERFKLLRKLLNEGDVNYSGEDFLLEHATIEPKTSMPIPLMMGGYSDTALNRVGRLSDGWVSYYYSPAAYSNSWNKVVSGARSAGRDETILSRVNIVPLAIASTWEEGDKLAKAFTSSYMDLPKNTQCTVDSSIRGTIEDCISQIRKFEASGVDELVFIPVNYDPIQVEMAGSMILPKFAN